MDTTAKGNPRTKLLTEYMLHSQRFALDMEASAILYRHSEFAQKVRGTNSPRPRWRCRRVFASKLWPVRNMQPHPASLVHPFSANPNHFLLGGLGGGPHEGSFGSYESAARVVSLIGANCDR
jgi:hypothetical protein